MKQRDYLDERTRVLASSDVQEHIDARAKGLYCELLSRLVDGTKPNSGKILVWGIPRSLEQAARSGYVLRNMDRNIDLPNNDAALKMLFEDCVRGEFAAAIDRCFSCGFQITWGQDGSSTNAEDLGDDYDAVLLWLLSFDLARYPASRYGINDTIPVNRLLKPGGSLILAVEGCSDYPLGPRMQLWSPVGNRLCDDCSDCPSVGYICCSQTFRKLWLADNDRPEQWRSGWTGFKGLERTEIPYYAFTDGASIPRRQGPEESFNAWIERNPELLGNLTGYVFRCTDDPAQIYYRQLVRLMLLRRADGTSQETI